jgi:hypothetical protein
VRKAMATKLAELSIGYPASPLTRPGSHVHAGPTAGQRAPIADNGDPAGAGSTPRFALFATSAPEGAELVGRHRELLEPEIRAPFAEGGIWLVRPDGYVATVAGRGGWANIDDYLQRVAAGPNQGILTL